MCESLPVCAGLSGKLLRQKLKLGLKLSGVLLSPQIITIRTHYNHFTNECPPLSGQPSLLFTIVCQQRNDAPTAPLRTAITNTPYPIKSWLAYSFHKYLILTPFRAIFDDANKDHVIERVLSTHWACHLHKKLKLVTGTVSFAIGKLRNFLRQVRKTPRSERWQSRKVWV